MSKEAFEAFERYFQMFMEALYKLLAALGIDFLYPVEVNEDGKYVKVTEESN